MYKIYQMLEPTTMSLTAVIGKTHRLVEFRNMVRRPTFKGATFGTHDEGVQRFLENHKLYGKHFTCITKPPKVEAKPEVKTEKIEDKIEKPSEKFIDEVTGKGYKTESALKGAITRRLKKEKNG